MTSVQKKRKAFVEQSDCVACGCCVKVCPLGAIQIIKGVMAQVDMEKCVGCGKCAKECPAGVIMIQEEKKKKKDGMITYGFFPSHIWFWVFSTSCSHGSA